MSYDIQSDDELIRAFVALYDKRGAWTKTFWREQQVAKLPTDLWIYQELLFEMQPDRLLETGSCIGGSAYFFATIMDLIGNGHVYTVDKDRYPNQPKHDRITYLTGDSVSPEIMERMRAVSRERSTMVVLDSLHTYEHVTEELRLYSPLVSPGDFLVVEDTGMGEVEEGQWANGAVKDFLKTHPEFSADEHCERHMLTSNKGGWLRRAHS